jgi:hypothetical protein
LKKRVLFKSAKDCAGRVVLNWETDPKHDLERMAEAYQLVAHDRIEIMKSQTIYPWVAYHAFPIVFLYRQSFELTLKAIVFVGADLLRDEGEEPMALQKIMTHTLTPLFEEVIRILELWKPGYTKAPLPPELPPELFRGDDSGRDRKYAGLPAWPGFEAIVHEFDEFDKNADTFRFSVKKDGTTSSLPKGGFDFDLFGFAAIMDRIIESLIHVPVYLREEMQERAKAAYKDHD